MKQVLSAARIVVVGAVAVGALSLGTAGVAGAASPTATSKAAKHFDCAKASKVLDRIAKGEAEINAGLPKLAAAEAKAQKAGKTKRADHLKKRIARLESARYKARLDKRASAIEAKCHVPAPSTTSGLGAGPVSTA